MLSGSFYRYFGGMANNVPLVPELMDQLRELVAEPILALWDRPV